MKDHSKPFDCDDGTLASDHVLRKWCDDFEMATTTAGMTWIIADQFKRDLPEAGFKEVEEKIFKVPLGCVLPEGPNSAAMRSRWFC